MKLKLETIHVFFFLSALRAEMALTDPKRTLAVTCTGGIEKVVPAVEGVEAEEQLVAELLLLLLNVKEAPFRLDVWGQWAQEASWPDDADEELQELLPELLLLLLLLLLDSITTALKFA